MRDAPSDSAVAPVPRKNTRDPVGLDALLRRGTRTGSLAIDEIAAVLASEPVSPAALDRFVRAMDDASVDFAYPRDIDPLDRPGPIPHEEQILRARRISVTRSRLRVLLVSSPIGAEEAMRGLDDAGARRIRTLLDDARTCYGRLIRGGNGMWNEMVLRHSARERSHRWSRFLEGVTLPSERMRAAVTRLEAYTARLADLRTADRSSSDTGIRGKQHGVLLETLEGYAALQARLMELRRRMVEFSRACAEMAGRNLRLVASIAKRYRTSRVLIADLVQEGMLGLMEAVERFDPERGLRFSTYAKWWIRRSLEEALGAQSHAVRLPARAAQRLRQIRVATRDLAQKLGRVPHLDECLRAAEVPAEEGARLSRMFRSSLSLDHTISAEHDATFAELLAHPGDGSGRSPDTDAALERALRALPFREQTILRLRFGIGVPHAQERPRIAELLKVSPERVRQLENAALAALRPVLDPDRKM